MKVIFETRDFGKIEVDQRERTVYFFADDFSTALLTDNTFRNQWGVPFNIHWPVNNRSEDCILEVTQPRVIAKAHPTKT